MKYIYIVVLILVVATAFGADDKKSNGIFSGLKVGQHVKLTDHGTAFTLSYFEKDLEFPHKVIEVGEHYIVVRDLAKETKIPVYAIKAVVKMKVE